MLQDERIPSWINAWRTWKFGETQKQICVCKQLEKNIFASLVVVREKSIFQRFGPICCLSHAALLKMEYFNLSIIMHKILWHTELMNVLNWGGKFNSCSNASCILKEDMNWIYVKRKWEQYSEGKKMVKSEKETFFRGLSKCAANAEFSISAQLCITSFVHFCQQTFNKFLPYQVSTGNVTEQNRKMSLPSRNLDFSVNIKKSNANAAYFCVTATVF